MVSSLPAPALGPAVPAGPVGIGERDLRICGALANAAAIGLLQERVIREHQLAARQIQHALDMLSQPGLLLPGQAIAAGRG